MILIGHGRIVAQGDKKSLLAGAQGAATSLVMSLDNAALAAELPRRGHLVDRDGRRAQGQRGDRRGRPRGARGRDRADRPQRPAASGLEDLFLELTSATARDVDAATVRQGSAPHEHRDRSLPALDISGTRPIPFWRLVLVELRKSYNTRAGFWLLFTIALLISLLQVVSLLAFLLQDYLVTFTDFTGNVWLVSLVLVPDAAHPAGDDGVEPAHRDGDLHHRAATDCG